MTFAYIFYLHLFNKKTHFDNDGEYERYCRRCWWEPIMWRSPIERMADHVISKKTTKEVEEGIEGVKAKSRPSAHQTLGYEKASIIQNYLWIFLVIW